MTAENQERHTVININVSAGETIRQESFSLGETLTRCRMDTRSYRKRLLAEFGDLWRADNHEKTQYQPGRRGRKERPFPRFHPEHVEYMLAAVNGLMTEREALDLWNLRKGIIKGELNSRAISLPANRRKKGGK